MDIRNSLKERGFESVRNVKVFPDKGFGFINVDDPDTATAILTSSIDEPVKMIIIN